MAREWRELGKSGFPDQEFETAWDVYLHAAQLIIDRTFEVQVTIAPTAPGGINSSDVVDMLGDADEGAVVAAKYHMAFCLGATAFLEDLKTFGGGSALLALIEEANPDAFW